MKKITLVCTLFTFLFSVVAMAQRITVTWGGTGTAGNNGDGLGGYVTSINAPHDVCIDANQNVYFTDMENGLIRKINANNGLVSTIAGGGTSSADGIPATSAAITPYFLTLDAVGNIYFTTGNKVRKINMASGIISTIAGTGIAGYTGDGSAAVSATLHGPTSVCVDASDNIFVLDSGNNCIRKVEASTGIISTYAGTGVAGYSGDGGLASAARFHEPTVMCMNSAGDIYVADQCYLYDSSSSGMYVRKITAATGIINTISGSTFSLANLFGVPISEAYLGHITGLCCDHDGNVYCNEISCSCRKFDFTTDSCYAVAGNFEIESYADDINSLLAYMNYPFGICADGNGNLFVADQYNNRIRRIIQLTHSPQFAFRKGQYMYPCTGYATPVNDLLSLVILDSAQTETFSLISSPVHGTVSGFPYSMLSKGTDSLTTPSGISYTSAPGYTGTDSFLVKVTNGAMADTMKIYVSSGGSSPVSVIAPPAVCVGLDQTLTASVSGGYYMLTNTNAVVSEDIVGGLVPGLDTAIYNIVGACVSNIVFSVVAAPDPGSISGSTIVCIGSAITLTETVTGGSWSTSTATLDSVGAASGIVTGMAAGSGQIQYNVSNVGCSVSSSFNITVGTPVGTISGLTYLPGASYYVCTGASSSFSTTMSGGIWSVTNSDATLAYAGSSASLTGNTQGLDTLLYTVSNTCGSAAASLIVAIDTNSSTTITAPASVCTGAAYYLAASDSGGIFTVTNGNAYISGSSFNYLIGYIAGWDTVMYYIAGTCPVAATFSVITSPSAGLVSGATSVCTGDTITPVDGISGGWWTTSTPGIISIDSLSGVVTGIAAGTASINYNVTVGLCTSNSPYTISVNTTPNAGNISGVNNIYAGTSTSLTDTVSGGTWSTTNFSISTTSVTGLIYGVAAGTDSVIYTVVSGSCSSSAYFSFTVTDSSTGISTTPMQTNKQITVIPNPSGDHFNINVQAPINEPVTVTISNMIGQVLRTFNANTNENIDGFMDAPAGVYLLNAYGDNLQLSTKIVKE